MLTTMTPIIITLASLNTFYLALNMYYCIYMKLTEINRIGMADAVMIN